MSLYRLRETRDEIGLNCDWRTKPQRIKVAQRSGKRFTSRIRLGLSRIDDLALQFNTRKPRRKLSGRVARTRKCGKCSIKLPDVTRPLWRINLERVTPSVRKLPTR